MNTSSFYENCFIYHIESQHKEHILPYRKKYKEHYFMNTYILSLAAGCALLLSFVLGVIVTDRIYQRVYDRSEERETPSPLS